MTGHVYIGVVGPGDNVADSLILAAKDVGHRLATEGAIIVTGGLGGVMLGASQGAKEHSGVAIGILPGDDRRGANDFLTAALSTGLGEARNSVVVHSSDVLIAVGGSWGTLNEIALALKLRKHVVGLDTWALPDASHAAGLFHVARSPEDAVTQALEQARSGPRIGGSPEATSRDAEAIDPWEQYDVAQRHYETNHDLHSSRMNLFLLVQSALVGLSIAGTGYYFPKHRVAISWFGIALNVFWFVMAVSSWSWIRAWRQHALELAGPFRDKSIASGFDFDRRRDVLAGAAGEHTPDWLHRLALNTVHRAAYFVRPTTIGLFMPFMFIAAWVYVLLNP